MLYGVDPGQRDTQKVRRHTHWDLHRMCFTEGRMQKQHNFHAPTYIACPLEEELQEQFLSRQGQQPAFSSTIMSSLLLKA